MFNKFKSRLAKRSTSSQGDSESTPSSPTITPPPLNSKKSQASIQSAPSTVRGLELDDSSRNIDKLGKALKSKLIFKAQGLRASASETSFDVDFTDEKELWDFNFFGTYFVILPKTSSVCLNHGGLRVNPSCNSPQVGLILEQAQTTRMQLVSALNTYSSTMDNPNSSAIPAEYLSLFKAITSYLTCLFSLLTRIDLGDILVSPELVVSWSCGLSRKENHGLNRPVISGSGLHLDRHFTLLALAGLMNNWGCATLNSNSDSIAVRRFLKSAAIYRYIAESVCPLWPSEIARPFDSTAEACRAMAQVCLHHSELIGVKLEQNKDKLGGLLASVTDQLTQAHCQIVSVSSTSTSGALGLVNFINEGIKLYQGILLNWRAQQLDEAGNQKAPHAASAAKATLKGIHPTDRTNSLHLSTLQRHLALATSLKASYQKIYKTISEWEGGSTAQDSIVPVDLSNSLFPAPIVSYSLTEPPLVENDFIFPSVLPQAHDPLPPPRDYLLQGAYY